MTHHEYPFDAGLTARFVTRVSLLAGVVLLLVLAATVLGPLPNAVLAAVALVVGVSTVMLSHVARRRPWVVKLDDRGYRVRFVRGAGVKAAPWRDVAEVSAQRFGPEPCVVLGLRDGRRTVVPVSLLAGTPEQFLGELESRLA